MGGGGRGLGSGGGGGGERVVGCVCEKDQMMNPPKSCQYGGVSGIQERKTKRVR